MTTKVRVNMFPCENSTEITAESADDGNYVVRASSSCEKAQRYVESLGPLSLIDLTDKGESKVFRNFLSAEMSANCLLPSGVMTALWAEAGMIARSMTRKGIPLAIEFVEG
ncbi:hypothetical protein AOA80_09480 [Methanomassiliicoccales archaeon RumEn M1]|jgi:hypothetical protein|nr:hypothetical protein AOA80_09480 [Methanomassiliicoccales archaeon RumEn M1]